jgi:hypothetical protein
MRISSRLPLSDVMLTGAARNPPSFPICHTHHGRSPAAHYPGRRRLNGASQGPRSAAVRGMRDEMRAAHAAAGRRSNGPTCAMDRGLSRQRSNPRRAGFSGVDRTVVSN